ncbi:MAG: pyridoxal phosphate-dependent aminotransferase [Acutalibacteraceae bacterium]|nr:pyridoxal phosphate-dependent aminotransferase [Acutalibacteraceae bacterium]
MLSQEMINLGQVRSVIREMFEYGNKRAAEIGRENVFDFSLGNPSVPAPAIVDETIKKLIAEEDSVKLHGYTSAPGDMGIRNTVANWLNDTYGTTFSGNNIYFTTGAAAALTITFKAIAEKDDEIIVFAPFFPEYKVFIENSGANMKIVKCRESDLQIDFEALKAALNNNTKAVVINSPCNPSGVVFSEETIKELTNILKEAETKFGHPIFLISDEPYRELVYDNIEVPFIPNYYDNTIVCYSFSKSLSLPGERIGYILISDKSFNPSLIFDAVAGAGRALGYVCASSLFQRVIPYCLGKTADIEVYKKNRDILCEALKENGFEIARPDGAFYLFVKALEKDANKFCENAKKFELLLVPSDSFGYEGYVRISYCVSTEQIINSLPAFKKLADGYKNGEF